MLKQYNLSLLCFLLSKKRDDQKYCMKRDWPRRAHCKPLPVGSVATETPNYRLKPFRENRWSHKTFFFSLFPKQYGITTLAFILCQTQWIPGKGLKRVGGLWKYHTILWTSAHTLASTGLLGASSVGYQMFRIQSAGAVHSLLRY